MNTHFLKTVFSYISFQPKLATTVTFLWIFFACTSCAKGRAAYGLQNPARMSDDAAFATIRAILAPCSVSIDTEMLKCSVRMRDGIFLTGEALICIDLKNVKRVWASEIGWSGHYGIYVERIGDFTNREICSMYSAGSEHTYLWLDSEPQAYQVADALNAIVANHLDRGNSLVQSPPPQQPLGADAAPQCRLNSDCPQGKFCQVGVCTAECREDRDCSGGVKCDVQNGRCIR